MNELNKHPVIFPKGEKVSNLIIQQCHIRCAHGGRGATLNELESSGYLITSCNAAVISFLFKCVKCRRLQGRRGKQKMADVLMHRPAAAPPFTYFGVDMFDPFVVKQCRKEIKHFGATFTCMASGAVHIEITHSLDTDSFIRVLRQVIARRGNIKILYSGNGNFVGCEIELKKVNKEIDNERIQSFRESFGKDLVR